MHDLTRRRRRLDPVALSHLETEGLPRVVGTTVAALLAIGAGASAASQIYSTKKAGDLNERSIEAQRESEAASRATELQKQERELAALEKDRTDKLAAERERQQRQIDADAAARTTGFTEAERARQEEYGYRTASQDKALALDKARYDAYIAANKPQWEAGAKIFGSLADLARVGTQGTQAPVAGAPGVAAPATATPGGAVASAPGARLSLMDLARLTAEGSSQATDPTTGRPITSRGAAMSVALPAPPVRRVATGQSQAPSLMDLIRQAIAEGAARQGPTTAAGFPAGVQANG